MNEKVKGVLAYFLGWIAGLIVLFACKNERNTNIHAAQSVVIGLLGMVCGFVLGFLPIPYLGVVISAIFYIIGIIGFIKVCTDAEPELPIVAGLAKSLFAGKIDG